MIIVIVGIWEQSASTKQLSMNGLTTSAHDLTHIIDPIRANHLVGFVNDGVPAHVSFRVGVS